MAQYDDTNTIVLFYNKENKGTNKPLFSGRVNVDGKWHKVALWKRNTQNPETVLFSGPVEAEEAQQTPASKQDFDDDLPF